MKRWVRELALLAIDVVLAAGMVALVIRLAAGP